MTRWIQLPAEVHALVANAPNSVLLQTARFDKDNWRSLVFLNAVRVITAWRLDEVEELFRQVDMALGEGFYVAGFVGYECGYHFEQSFQKRFGGLEIMQGELPLAWFGVYRRPAVFDHTSGRFEGDFVLPKSVLSPKAAGQFAERVELVIAEEEYQRKISQIKEHIAAGETYQVNFTDKVHVPVKVTAEVAFSTLLKQQPVAYGALLNIAGQHVLSLSPELFFRIEGRRIVTRPMKGTMPRGLDCAEDSLVAARLKSDEKNRAEHVMIVDLLRNDLGRISEMGSVRVDEIFIVERYDTLLQMTSTVSGKLREGLSYYEIFKGMFPSGSITGAPKIRTMEIIHDLEREPRGVYTGAIGFVAPDGQTEFNVAIRTLVIKDDKAVMGVGGGIVADSEAADEYRECLLKARFLKGRRRNFELIETLLWDGEYFLLELHLDRLAASAEYFGFSCDREEVVTRLMEETNGFTVNERYRVRLLLDGAGKIVVAPFVLELDLSAGRILLSCERTSSRDVFLRHKTTRRELYNRELQRAQAEGFDDVIFLNERDEVTEGAVSNLFIRRDGILMTPPLASGVLPGVLRRHLLETQPMVERVLKLKDLEAADAILIGNSVRGLREVRLHLQT